MGETHPQVWNIKHYTKINLDLLIVLIFFFNFEFRGDDQHGKSAVQYKSDKRTDLVKQGYRIVGNVGDQWSDLIGTNVGSRTFKVPDPMYYIAWLISN